jgi:hypothetical protein
VLASLTEEQLVDFAAIDKRVLEETNSSRSTSQPNKNIILNSLLHYFDEHTLVQLFDKHYSNRCRFCRCCMRSELRVSIICVLQSISASDI